MGRAIGIGGIYFAVVFAAGFALGVLRSLWLAPRWGPTLAVAAELPLMLAISWLVCTRIDRRWQPQRAEAAVIGLVALLLLLLAEAAISTTLAGRSLAQHLALYARVPELLGLAGQLVFAAFPVIQAWGPRPRIPAGR